jgi:hypothetical protein
MNIPQDRSKKAPSISYCSTNIILHNQCKRRNTFGDISSVSASIAVTKSSILTNANTKTILTAIEKSP